MRDGLCRRTVRTIFAIALASGMLCGSAAFAAPPVVAGFEQQSLAKLPDAERGQLLLGELNCTACHKTEGAQRIEAKGAPDLSQAGARITPQYLRAYLTDPHKVKPGATMPDVFHASADQARQGAVEFLTHYLVSLGGPMKASEAEGNTVIVGKGRELYHTVGCVACHAPEKEITGIISSVPIGPQALKTTVEQLTAFLLDPLKDRPHGRMPSSNLAEDEARAIAIYLLRDQLENPQVANAPPARSKGLRYSYYQNVQLPNASIEEFEKLTPTAEGSAEQISVDIPERTAQDNFALRFSGVITVPRDGTYTFVTGSDDGSRLYIDEQLVVDNDGVHGHVEKDGKIDLKAGDHTIVITYYEQAGGESLVVGWEGPEIPRQVISADVLFNVAGTPMVPLESAEFVVEPQKAQMGQRMFGMLGCANCHAQPDVQPGRPAKLLAELNLDSAEGCLSPKPARGIPQYHLSDPQRAAIVAGINSDNLASAFEPAERVVRTLSQMNCYACHKRDDVGGVQADRNPFFVMTQLFDMGDEGRIPPKLTGAGGKLKTEALDQIIFEGNLHVRRHHMATRMPRFARETAGVVVDALAKADPPPSDFQPPEFNAISAKEGRLLVGTKGLGCVNCHGVAGVPSLGMPSMDLSTVYERLKPGWFHPWMLDPNQFTPGTRMPAFWFKGTVVYKDVAGGTADGQIGAIWNYLSLGKGMPLPAGLQPTNGYELIPVDEPLIHRTFMAEVGPRAVLVGYPDNIHIAFDANTVRLAKAWRGKFFDAKGMWEGRGGQHLGPLGEDVLNLPPGPSFAVLATPDAPWPQAQPNERNLGGKFKGYILDKEKQPIFRYDLNGLEIQEKPFPVLKAGGAVLVRKFQLTAKDPQSAPPPAGLSFLAAAGQKIEPGAEAGEWVVDDKLKLRITSPTNDQATVREGNGQKQLILPVTFDDGGLATFDVEMSW